MIFSEYPNFEARNSSKRLERVKCPHEPPPDHSSKNIRYYSTVGTVLFVYKLDGVVEQGEIGHDVARLGVL